MFEASNLISFSLAALALVVTPGPAVIYIVTRSVDQGRSAGLFSVFGIVVGGFIHVLITTFGISLLFSISSTAFNGLKILGAGYFIYLAIITFKRNKDESINNKKRQQSLKQIFRQGILVNVLNPKAVLFFLAFLPQFAHPENGSLSVQIFLLGLLFITIALISDTTYALLAGHAGKWLKKHPQFSRYQKYFSATVYFLLGIAALLA